MAILLVLTLAGMVPTAPPISLELAPPPRPIAYPVAIYAISGGYRIALNKPACERLQKALEGTDENQIATALREMAREKKTADPPDDEGSAKLELLAFLVSSQIPAFKSAIQGKVGSGGVTITVTGLQAATIKFRQPRPRLERAVEFLRETMPLLPDEVRETVEALRAVARTTPLFWKVEPRE